MNNQRFAPRQRTAIDGVTWWCVYDILNHKYSTLLCHGRYKTKKACRWAIDRYKDLYMM